MMIAKEDRRERKGKKVHKKSVPRKNKRSTKTHYFLPKEREKREKSETKKLPKNSFCSSLKRVIIFHSRHLSYSFITYLKRVFIPSSTTTTTIIPLYYRNDDSDDVGRESKQYF